MRPATAPDVLVVGAGVVGLTTAICLAEQGLAVLVRADRPPGETTSAVAGRFSVGFESEIGIP